MGKIRALYLELSNLERKGYLIELPTVGVTLFAYDGKGNEIVCHGAKAIGYPTILLNPESDVARYIERGVSIVFTSRDITCGKVSLEQFAKVYASDLRKLGLDPSKAYGVLKFVAKKGARLRVSGSGSCPIYKEVVINEYLYSSRYSPPKGWLSHFSPSDRDYARRLWYVFATRYSKAYLYNAQFFTKDEALQNVELKLGIGLMPMQKVVHMLAEELGGYEPTWIPTPLPPITRIDDMPWLGIALYYSERNLEDSVETHGALSSLSFSYSYSGISLFGIPLYSNEYAVLKWYTESLGISATMRDYLIIPTAFIYVGDGLVVNLNVVKIEDPNGCEYYMVWPEISFVPIYSIRNVDWGSAKEVVMDYDKEPKALSDLLWSAHAELVYDNLVGTSRGIVYVDSSEFSKIKGIAGSLVSIYKPMFDKVIEGVLDSLRNAIAREMIAFTISSLAFEQFSVAVNGLEHHFAVLIQHVSSEPYPLEIYKMVCPQVLADVYRKAGYVPYAIEYLVDVGYVSTPPGAR